MAPDAAAVAPSSQGPPHARARRRRRPVSLPEGLGRAHGASESACTWRGACSPHRSNTPSAVPLCRPRALPGTMPPAATPCRLPPPHAARRFRTEFRLRGGQAGARLQSSGDRPAAAHPLPQRRTTFLQALLSRASSSEAHPDSPPACSDSSSADQLEPGDLVRVRANPNPIPKPEPSPSPSPSPSPNLEPGGFHLGRGSSLRYNLLGRADHVHPAFRPLEATAAAAAEAALQVRGAARHAAHASARHDAT